MTMHRGTVPGNLRHNMLTLGADFAFFLVALAFVSQSTILPAFARHLGAPNVVIGAIPAVMTLGWFLPSLFAAGYTSTLPRKLPFILRYTVWERVPLLGLALAAFVVADRAPALALGLLLATLGLVTGVGGTLVPAWMDLVGRAVPVDLRGRFLALSSLAGSVGGLLASFATAWILATVAAPHSFGVCFLLSTFFMGLSYWALALVREPPGGGGGAALPLGAYLRRIPGLLQRDRNLSWFLTARALAAAGAMASGFYTVYALGVLAAGGREVGLFTAALFGGQAVGNLVLGWLADRAGHRLVVIAGVAATLGANLLALGAPSLLAFNAVFVFAGLHIGATNVSGFAVFLELAPTPDDRPTYIGLGSTMVAPVAFAAPLLAGILADTVGFAPVFLLGGSCAALALGVLVFRVEEPRRARPS
jgi:MFS family permease